MQTRNNIESGQSVSPTPENLRSIKRLEALLEDFKSLSPDNQNLFIGIFEAEFYDAVTEKDGVDPELETLLDKCAAIFRAEASDE